MKHYVIYSMDSGQILQSGTCADGDLGLVAVEQGQTLLVTETFTDPDCVVVGGEAVPKPHRPSPHHIFDYTLKQWVDPRTLDDLKRLKWAGIKQAQALEEASGFAWNGSTFDSSRTSQERIRTAAQAATVASLKGAPYKVDWVLRDNTSRALTGPDMLEVAAALWAHIAALHARAQILRQRIEAAGSAGALDKIVW